MDLKLNTSLTITLDKEEIEKLYIELCIVKNIFQEIYENNYGYYDLKTLYKINDFLKEFDQPIKKKGVSL